MLMPAFLFEHIKQNKKSLVVPHKRNMLSVFTLKCTNANKIFCGFNYMKEHMFNHFMFQVF